MAAGRGQDDADAIQLVAANAEHVSVLARISHKLRRERW
jgi:hypothetical protein